MLVYKKTTWLNESLQGVNKLIGIIKTGMDNKKYSNGKHFRMKSFRFSKKNNKKIVIFGNSGAGKSTLAKEYATKYGLAHLDLDTLAWLATTPPTRKSIEVSTTEINQFIEENACWVIEGCYADLLKVAVEKGNEVVFLNPSIDTCIRNCENKPFEPHKYDSIEAQNANLAMLIHWIKEYTTRTDEFSLVSHQELFDTFTGKKKEYNSNDRMAVSF